MSASMDRGFEQALVAAMTEDVGRPPERLLAEILGETQSMRPLPAPVALLAAPPMVLPKRVVVGVRRSRIMLVAAALLLAATALLAGALLIRPVPPPDAWTGWGGSASRAAVSATGPTGKPRAGWTFQAVGAIDSTPVIAGGLIIVSSRDGILHALEAESGVERWNVQVGAGIGPPATDGSLVFIEDGGGSMHALQLADGSPLWTVVALGSPVIDPAVADGTLYLATEDGGVTALDTRDGSTRWKTPVGGPSTPIAGLAVSEDVVVATVGDARLVALRRDSGREAWSAPLDRVPPGTPVAARGLAWAGPGDDVREGALRAFRLSDGTSAWTVEEAMFAPAVAGDLAVTANADGLVTGRDAATGVERWRRATAGTLRVVAIAGGTAFVLSVTNRQIFGIDTATGALLWQLALDAEPGCCIAVAQGLLVVGTTSGRVTAFESGPDPSASASAAAPAAPTPSEGSATHRRTPAASLEAVPLVVMARYEPAPLGIDLPLGVVQSPSGDIFVTDTGQHVTRLTAEGTVAAQWGGKGSADGQFDFGTFEGGTNARGAIALGPDGLVYVSDADNHRVQVFTPDGTFVRSFGSLGTDAGQFTIPFDLTVDADGNVFVLDDGAERITKVAPDGTPIWIADQRSDPRLTGHPHSPVFDGAGRLVVTVDDTQTIARLDPETGQVIDTLPGGGCESALDPWDRIFVTDCAYELVSVLDANGQLLATDAELGLRTLRLNEDGSGVAVDADGTLLVVAVTPP